MKTLVSVKVEDTLKQQAQKTAADLGFSMSALINAFLKQLIREKTVSFSLSNRMSKTLEQTLVLIERDIAENKNLSPKFFSSKEAVDYLKSL